jgi:hypothetical protein
MRLSPRALAFTLGLIWGGAMLCVGLAHLAVPDYGAGFLSAMSSVYPGFHQPRGVLDVTVGTVYGLLDGGAAGLVAGWLYNRLSHTA